MKNNELMPYLIKRDEAVVKALQILDVYAKGVLFVVEGKNVL